MAKLVLQILTVTADESPNKTAGYKVWIPVNNFTKYAATLGGAIKIVNDQFPNIPKRLAYRHIDCPHENLMARVLEADANGVILEKAEYWCILCNEYIPFDKLMPDKEAGDDGRKE